MQNKEMPNMTLPEDIRTLLQKRTAFLEREEMMKKLGKLSN